MFRFIQPTSFISSDGSLDLTPIPTILIQAMEQDYPWIRKDETQRLPDGITIYDTNVIANTN